MSLFSRCCGGGGQEAQSSASHSLSSPPRSMQGRRCECSTDKMIGTTALVAGIGMVVMAIVVASGVFGAGKMYFLAGGLGVGSILPLALAAYKLSCKGDGVREFGNKQIFSDWQRQQQSAEHM